MQFVALQGGVYRVSDAARAALETRTEPVRVVGVVGKYRTGKSTLLNRLAEREAFETSATVNACTYGLTLHAAGDVCYLDSEGLGSPDANANHDANIFALAAALSSCLLLNTQGNITSTSIAELHLASKTARILASHAELKCAPPELLWVVRDFGLELCTREDRAISSDEYMENCLREAEEPVADMFPRRSCVTLPHFKGAGFAAGVERVRARCAQAARALTGAALLRLADALCAGLNEHAAPNVQSVWSVLSAAAEADARAAARAAWEGQAPDLARAAQEAHAAYARALLDPDGCGAAQAVALLAELLEGDGTLRQALAAEAVARQRAAGLEAELAALGEHDAARDARLGSLLAEKLGLEERAHRAQEAEVRARDLQAHAERMGDCVEQLKDKHAATRAELGEAQGQLQRAAEAARRLERERQDARRLLDAETARAEGFGRRLRDEAQTSQRLTTELAVLQAKADAPQPKRQRLEDAARLVECESEVRFLRESQAQLREESAALRQENAGLRQDKQDLAVQLAIARA
jgi:ABC-type cobalamin transport system ATPase subunit